MIFVGDQKVRPQHKQDRGEKRGYKFKYQIGLWESFIWFIRNSFAWEYRWEEHDATAISMWIKGIRDAIQ